MKSVFVLEHVPHEKLGSFESLLARHNLEIRVVNLLENPELPCDVTQESALIIMGGPMSVHDTKEYPGLLKEKSLIEQAIKNKIPTLGICLGAQLIATVLGGEVTRNPVKEIGWYPLNITTQGKQDPLFKNFDSTETVFQWHGETFSIPPGASLLASSPLCSNQAFSYQGFVYGLQFHVEVTAPMIKEWFCEKTNTIELESLKDIIHPQTIINQTPALIPRLSELSLSFFENFLSLIH